jgi:ABC-type spermidine/putrescine transport system permease subunit II
MKPIEEVWAMDIFVPGLTLTIIGAITVSFIQWKARWFQALIAAAFWIIPVFFLVVLQYYLWDFGHTMKEDAALSMDPFTPKVIGSTSVWNFHTNNGLQIGFFLMVLAAITITFLPIAIRKFQSRRSGSAEEAEAAVTTTGTTARGAI